MRRLPRYPLLHVRRSSTLLLPLVVHPISHGAVVLAAVAPGGTPQPPVSPKSFSDLSGEALEARPSPSSRASLTPLHDSAVPALASSESTSASGSGSLYPDWWVVRALQKYAPRLWAAIDYYYSSIVQERELLLRKQTAERMERQQRELDHLKSSMEKLIAEREQLHRDISRSLLAEPRKTQKELHHRWRGAHDKLKERQDRVEAEMSEIKEKEDETLQKHEKENRLHDEVIAAARPREQLDILIRCIAPTYYLIFFLLGLLGWLYHQNAQRRDRELILQKLCLAGDMGATLSQVLHSLTGIREDLAKLRPDTKSDASRPPLQSAGEPGHPVKALTAA
eukprot:RCo013280